MKTRRWIVSCRVIFNGATAEVDAPSRDEALAKAERGEFVDAIDIAGAELIDWKVNKIDREGWSE
jgi:hypothetical protein